MMLSRCNLLLVAGLLLIVSSPSIDGCFLLPRLLSQAFQMPQYPYNQQQGGLPFNQQQSPFQQQQPNGMMPFQNGQQQQQLPNNQMNGRR